MKTLEKTCWTLVLLISLILLIASIYDGRETWRIILYAAQFVFCAAGLIVSKLERRKKNSE